MNQAGTQEQVSREARGWLDRVTVDESVLELCPGYRLAWRRIGAAG